METVASGKSHPYWTRSRSCPQDDGIFEIIRDKLYLSDAASAQNLEALRPRKITRIINLSSHAPCPFEGEIAYLHLKYGDGDPALLDSLKEASEFIEGEERVLVHCRLGRSRSAALIIAYLMRSRSLGFEEARRVVSQAKTDIKLHWSLENRLLNL